MKSKWYLCLCSVLCCAIGSLVVADQGVPKVPVAACDACPLQGTCTIEVPYVGEIAEVAEPEHAAAERPDGRRVVKVVVAPARVVMKIREAKPVRSVVGKIIKAKPARKAVKAVAKARPARRVASLICPRKRCNRE